MNIGLSKLKPFRLLSPSPGQRPGILQMINIAPCKGKILVCNSLALTGRRRIGRPYYSRGAAPGCTLQAFQALDCKCYCLIFTCSCLRLKAFYLQARGNTPGIKSPLCLAPCKGKRIIHKDFALTGRNVNHL